MLLVIDVGNTQTNFGVFKGEKLIVSWRISTNTEETADELAVTLSELFNLKGILFNGVKGVAIASVVPHCTAALQEMCQKFFGLEPLIVSPGTKTGIVILYDNPHEIGPDRIVNAVAAYELYGGPVIVVDFGTATTFDAVSKKGEYLGGAIAPGIEISTNALFEHAARLSKVDLVKPPRVIGKNTRESLQSGIIFGFAGQVDEVVRKMDEELNGKAEVIATGGLAPFIAPECATVDKINVDLTLIGLKKVWERNKKAE